jgi:hypothetical protein
MFCGLVPKPYLRQHRRTCLPSDTKFFLPCRTVKKTEIFWGIALKLYLRSHLFDARLTGLTCDAHGNHVYVAQLDYSKARIEVEDEVQWQLALAGQPLAPAQRRGQYVTFLRAKMLREDQTLRAEGLHGLWELCMLQDFQDDLSIGAPLWPPLCMLSSTRVQYTILALPCRLITAPFYGAPLLQRRWKWC